MKKVVIVGAGPAGLSAGYFLSKNGFDVEIYDSASQVGGLAKTIKYKGFYFDLGGHRFFTKIKEVEDLWGEILDERDFLKVKRLSRIYYNGKFFYYPLKPWNAFYNLGPLKSFMAVGSYIWRKIFPISPEVSFEDWVSNQFGSYLFRIFFKCYTEKVWGISCKVLSKDWAKQRIKKLNLFNAILGAFFPSFTKGKIRTLITQFKYPRFGPGMFYEAMARKMENSGGKTYLQKKVKGVLFEGPAAESIILEDGTKVKGDFFIWAAPLNYLFCLENSIPNEVLKAGRKLKFRGFLTCALILDQKNIFPDNWIYIHSPEVRLARIQNFKNWSPYMVPDENKTCLGLEYFCNENDEFWNKSDEEIKIIAEKELKKINLISRNTKVLDYKVERIPNAYPVYYPGYSRDLKVIKNFFEKIANLYIIGRSGMYRYNNMDHSIYTGILAGRNIMGEENDIWRIGAEDDYLEEVG